MRIGITVGEGVTSSGAGVATYIRNLVRALLEVDRANEYLLIYCRTGQKPIFPMQLTERAHLMEIPIPRRLLQRGLWFPLGWPPIEYFTGPLDLLHHTGVSTAVPTRLPLVITVHDLCAALSPKNTNWKARLWKRRLWAQIRGQAHCLISVSEATKEDAICLFGLSPKHVTTIPLTLPLDFFASLSVQPEPVLAEYGISRPFLFFVGRTDPRKNMLNLLLGFAEFVQTTKYPHLLVVGGSLGTGANRVLSRVRTLGLTERVKFLGYLPQEHVVALMKEADVFVYPSRCEGFGFPLLEAMACKTPIAASGVSSIPEVAGDAARYFSPEDPADIASVLCDIVSNETLKAQLVQAGQVRLNFHYPDWQWIAKRTLEVYARVLSEARKQ